MNYITMLPTDWSISRLHDPFDLKGILVVIAQQNLVRLLLRLYENHVLNTIWHNKLKWWSVKYVYRIPNVVLCPDTSLQSDARNP